jgi:hypothetical protein
VLISIGDELDQLTSQMRQILIDSAQHAHGTVVMKETNRS